MSSLTTPVSGTLPSASCLNCGAPLERAFCASCGQRAVDLAEPTWDVIREAVAEAVDVDGRVARTLRALLRPGGLTAEWRRGRRVPYVGPFKLFLVAGAVLSTTWVLTRRIDATFYRFAVDASAGAYIQAVTRGLLAGGLAIALGSWALSLGRRRLVDEVVFALHLLAALALLASVVIWLAAGFKLIWGTVDHVPSWVPSLLYLLFLPSAAAGLAYVVAAVRRVDGGAWWAVALRSTVLAAAGVAAVSVAAYLGGRG